MKKIAVSKDSGMDTDEDEISELPSVPGHIDKKGFFHKKKPDKDGDNISISSKATKNLVAKSSTDIHFEIVHHERIHSSKQSATSFH